MLREPTFSPTNSQQNSISSINKNSSNSQNPSTSTIVGIVVGIIALLVIVGVIFCLTTKNKKLDAFTKWRLHYDVKKPVRRDTPARLENDIHHFYKRNPSREFTPYVSTSQINSQRNSLKPQSSMKLPMVEYNGKSSRL
jgi:hypothetical protein